MNKLNLELLWKAAVNEAEWLRYYGHTESRNNEEFLDENFYERIESIGYTKKVIQLPMRCANYFITSDSNLLESNIEDIITIGSNRNHKNNIYTPLEYFIGKKIGLEQLIKIIKN